VDNRPRDWWPSITNVYLPRNRVLWLLPFHYCLWNYWKTKEGDRTEPSHIWWIKLPNSLFFIFIFCREGINLRFKKYKSTKDKKKNTNIQNGSSVWLIHLFIASLYCHTHTTLNNLPWPSIMGSKCLSQLIKLWSDRF
jgi:hypothetical protein